MAAERTGDMELIDDEVTFEELSGGGAIHRLLVRELGADTANAFAYARRAQERRARRLHPDEGLRERKKRLTRQQMSDVATTLFVVRGFDHVKVSDVAEIVGVSEKTVYNYFPTKEALVFDRADETIARLAAALRESDADADADESPTKAVLRAFREDMEGFEDLPDAIHVFMPLFAEMVASTPALRAAWLDLQGRLVAVATTELAARADVDPRDPEPMIAARAIVGLQEVAYAARIRHIEDGLRGAQLRDAVLADLERAARLLDTGLWSFNLLTQGARTRAQLRDAALAAEDTRRQVVTALKQARTTWRDLRKREGEELKREHNEIKQVAKEIGAAARREALRAAEREVKRRTERGGKSERGKR
ncbi:MAG TPA: TetR family transcriptional regulator [Solirubrobacteraceae bacterium]|nr:TetR family transcriptional regulator [Solirubrobacteraceae bacterium]